ncbi:MAG TPA: hypothetical protein VGL11_24780 [Candidatus Binatia bacterium]|jgi:hypothetical protein
MSLKKLQLGFENLALRVLNFDSDSKYETRAAAVVRSISRLCTRLLIVLPAVLITGVNSELFNILTDFYRELTGRS